jgi:hypothetical protein
MYPKLIMKMYPKSLWPKSSFVKSIPGAVDPAHPDGDRVERLLHVLPDGLQLFAVAAPRRVKLWARFNNSFVVDIAVFHGGMGTLVIHVIIL